MLLVAPTELNVVLDYMYTSRKMFFKRVLYVHGRIFSRGRGTSGTQLQVVVVPPLS